MRKSRLSEAKQAKLIEHFVIGNTARFTADLVGVNRMQRPITFSDYGILLLIT